MARSKSLSPEDRDLFALVARAGSVNPFSSERAALNRRFGGDDSERAFDRAMASLDTRLSVFEKRRSIDPSELGTQDAALLERAILFEAFHRFAGELDALIEAQRASPEAPVRAAFAPGLLTRLTTRGIHSARAERWLAFIFQLRRAWFFVGGGLVGAGPSMQRLREACWNAIFTRDLERYGAVLWDRMEDFSILLLGETGTGKGAAASAIGRSGFVPYDARRETFAPSFASSFVAVNLAEVPETLLESELFGHDKGAFTGALAKHQGVLERAPKYGAIFLDEIGELAPHVQVKLLRVLQERTFRALGSQAERRFEGRVLAATHRSLEALRADGSFRDDFYFRLSTEAIHVPALRERLAQSPRELEELVHVVLTRTLGEVATRELASEVWTAIVRDVGADYTWPGNVRELEQCVRGVLLTGACAPDPRAKHTGAARGASDLSLAFDAGTLSADELLDGYCAALYDKHGTYEAVARVTGLDRRTVKRRVHA